MSSKKRKSGSGKASRKAPAQPEAPPLIRSSFAEEEQVKAAKKFLRRPGEAPVVVDRPEAHLGADELGLLRLMAGRVSEAGNLYAFVMSEKSRRRFGIPLRRCEDGDIVLIALSLDGEAVPVVMCWNESARAFEDPISGTLFRLLVDCYILLKPGSRRRFERAWQPDDVEEGETDGSHSTA